MNPEDDPEARIRELEQPLADAARASELGDGGGYSYPPPPPGPVPAPMAPTPLNPTPPPYGYNSPYPGGTPRSSSGFRWFWILAAVGILAVLVLVGGIAAYAARQLSHDDVTARPSSQRASATTATGGRTQGPAAPSGKTNAPSTGPPSSATAPAEASVIVSGINENRTIACSDNAITVSGISNTVAITGHCASVTVSGLNNVVTVETADTIDASGLNNKVTYHSGTPQVSKSGSGNVVEQG